MSRPRVLLADDHTLLLDAFEKLIETECEVVGKVADGRALLTAAKKLEPDVIVLDIEMPKLNGLDAGEQLKRAQPKVKLIFLTVNEDPDIAAEAFRIGASGYLLKNSASSELFHAIQEALEGRVYVTSRATKGMVESLTEPQTQHRRLRKLTARQREVLQLLAEGHSMKATAGILHITPRTVAFHKYRMMDELGLETNAQLLRYAIKQGLVAG